MASASSSLVDPSSSGAPPKPTNITTPKSPNNFLSFPSSSQIEETEPRPKDPQGKQKKQLLKDRLYVGNLHPTVNECVLHRNPTEVALRKAQVHAAHALRKVRDDHLSRLLVPQDWPVQRQASGICLCRV